MMSNLSEPSAPVTKNFLCGFLKCAEMSFYYPVFRLVYLISLFCIHLEC